ncbi:MAG TPA: hypothetical protein VFQ75_01310, partial [Candidatus Limnocylindrales bacterium]|nr:hypothetical protein [Candidatus Limnocylindrales bacterium]
LEPRDPSRVECPQQRFDPPDLDVVPDPRPVGWEEPRRWHVPHRGGKGDQHVLAAGAFTRLDARQVRRIDPCCTADRPNAQPAVEADAAQLLADGAPVVSLAVCDQLLERGPAHEVLLHGVGGAT